MVAGGQGGAGEKEGLADEPLAGLDAMGRETVDGDSEVRFMDARAENQPGNGLDLPDTNASAPEEVADIKLGEVDDETLGEMARNGCFDPR